MSLPADLETILVYVALLAESKSYTSIPNYLSAVWVIRKINALSHLDPSTFEITITLRGIRRVIGKACLKLGQLLFLNITLYFLC